MTWKKAIRDLGKPRIIAYVAIFLTLVNLDAILDLFMHPDIDYFDDEHVIMGGTAGMLMIVLLYIFHSYTRKLEKAYATIEQLERVLPICSECKKIRIPGGNPAEQTAWQNVDEYITEKTKTVFSHGLCPACQQKLYGPYLNHQRIE